MNQLLEARRRRAYDVQVRRHGVVACKSHSLKVFSFYTTPYFVVVQRACFQYWRRCARVLAHTRVQRQRYVTRRCLTAWASHTHARRFRLRLCIAKLRDVRAHLLTKFVLWRWRLECW